jgi:cytochrome b6-f complex iron-sulfur subunit
VSGRPVRRFVDALLRGERTERARPDDLEAQEMKTAIELRAARTGSDSPREEFITDLHRRLAEQMSDVPQTESRSSWGPSGTRRQVVIGTGLAAASAATGIVVGRNLLAPSGTPAKEASPPTQGVLEPNAGTWHAVGASADLPKGGALAFDLGSVNGFVHRADAKVEAVSGICTHQGCKLWLDAPESRLRCPCHSTSFSLEGETLTHQLPTAPAPLPKFAVRETNGVIEVFAPTKPA